MTKKEKLEFCKKWIQRLNGDHSELNDDRVESMKYERGDPSIVKVVNGRSQLTTTDMRDAIESSKPDILETIAGIDDPLKLDPVGPEDVEPVKKLEILANIMVRRKNKWYRLCSDFLNDSMILKFGVFKYQWTENEKTVETPFKNLDDLQLQAKLSSEGSILVSDEFDEDGNRKTVIKKITKDPKVEITTVPSERLKFPLDSSELDNTCPFVFEEVQLYRNQFIATYGKKVFDKVDEEKRDVLDGSSDNVREERFDDLGGLSWVYDDENGKYMAYECYFPNEDEDGKPWLFVFSGEQVIYDEFNKYGKPPYRGGSPFLLAHRLIGNGYIDYLKEIQEQRTFIKRQIFDNLSMSNYRRYFGDAERMNMDDYLNNNATNALIRVQGDPSTIVKAEEKAPLPAELMTFWEMMKVEKDEHIPTPRSYGGIEVEGMQERTYRGKQLKVNQASKKILMMMRSYMEDVFAPLFSDVIDCILQFMDKETTIRYLNTDYEINPDNIIGKFDLVVNVGLGTNDKNDVVAKLQQLVGLAFQAMQTGAVTSQNIYYIFSELVKAMGFLNTTDFVTDPKLKDAVMQLLQLVMQIPELAQVAQPLMQPIMQGFGIQPPKPGSNTQGTAPGQNTPEQPALPMENFGARQTIDGGGFFS